jgi:hypothetical protein
MAGALITVAETPLFVRQAQAVWDDDERTAFVSFIAANPAAGDCWHGRRPKGAVVAPRNR